MTWRREFRGYPSGGAFALAYTLINRAAKYDIADSQVVGEAGDYIVTVPATATATWAPGKYRWQAYISDGDGNRFTVDEGEIRVLPNLQIQTSGFDDRESDEKSLDDIIALLAGKFVEGDSQMYEIHGRKNQRYTFDELIRLRSYYALRVRDIRIRRGERVSSRTVRTAFCG